MLANYPLLPLDTFRSFLQWSPWHFFQIGGGKVPVNSQCNTVVYEYGWQNGQTIGRSEMLEKIAYAEEKIASYLRYDVAPRYHDETQMWESHNPATYYYPAWSVMTLQWGYVQAVGVQTLTSITSAAVTYSSQFNNGLNDTFSLSFATTVTDPNEIALYFAAADRYDGSDASDKWRIRPVQVSITGGIATVRGPAWLLVKPVLYGNPLAAQLAPDDTANFVTTLEAYRLWTDGTSTDAATSPGVIGYDKGYCNCGATEGQIAATATIRDSATGIVSLSSCTSICGCPAHAQVRYVAGLPLVNGQMNPFWAEVVSMVTLAELPGPICACKEANKRIEHWQVDLARTGAGESYGMISGEDLNNPLGTRRGHVEAWKRIAQLRNMRGFSF
jgi:hypothetical protein